jgi:Ca2+-binding RTX toxin-like protein
MAIINGTAGSDTLVDNPGEADTINALGGDDTITVTGGADTVLAGTGNDTLNFSVSALASVTADMGEGADFVNVSTAAPGQIRLTFTSAEIGNGAANDSNTLTNQDGGLAVRFQAETAAGVLTGPVSRFDDENIIFTSIPGTTFDVRDLVSGIARGDLFRTVALGSTVGDLITFANDFFPVYANGGLGNDTITGGTQADVLVGGAGDDVLDGANGDDTFIGGAGNDTITGGAGNDIAIINVSTDGADSVNLGEGADFVNVSAAAPGQVRLTFTSAEVGNGAANDSNTLTNQDGGLAVRFQAEDGTGALTGPVSRFDDENIIFTSIPGTTFDVRDLVSGIARGDLFRTVALGSTDGDLITFANDLFPVYVNGGLGDDTITGGTQADVLVGGAGNDLLTGAAGNDTYIVDSSADLVIEQAGGGIDTIISSVSRTLSTNVENLVLSGAASLSGNGNLLANAITGNAGNNALRGNDGNDTLEGGDGNDLLYGDAGVDRMVGGLGNDTFYVDTFGEQTIELAGQGTDTVISSISLTLAANIETLLLQGSGNLLGNGNTLSNVISGNSGNNVLRGFDGADRLLGNAGDDILFGDAGLDVLTGGAGRDTIYVGNDADRDTVAFGAAAESTGSQRDIVLQMDLNGEDRFDFPVVPVSIAAAVTGGTLNTATFNIDLAVAIGAAQLGAGQAVLFDPSAGSGNIAGHAYLVVDANGVAGFQAGQDYVVQLINATGTLSLDDFI